MSESLVWRLIMRDNSEPAATSFRKTLEKVREDTENHANAFAKAGEVTQGFSTTLMRSSALIGTASTALVNGAGAAVAFAHSAAVASGALLLIPGAIAAGGVGLIRSNWGYLGVADAFKQSAKGGKEYQAALKNWHRNKPSSSRPPSGRTRHGPTSESRSVTGCSPAWGRTSSRWPTSICR
jgi:hypothetical protein